jgi:hypothetical protein
MRRRGAHAFKTDRREDCVQTPAKMARSDPLPPFRVPVVTAVISAASRSCQNQGEAPKIHAKSRVIWGIPVHCSCAAQDDLPSAVRGCRGRHPHAWPATDAGGHFLDMPDELAGAVLPRVTQGECATRFAGNLKRLQTGDTEVFVQDADRIVAY